MSSDFHSMTRWPRLDDDPGVDGTTVRQLADERWAVATNGPAVDRANAEPMQWVFGETPICSALK